jgi:ABC-2 type transport system permease protein
LLRRLFDYAAGIANTVMRYAGIYLWYLRSNWLSLMAYPVPFVVVNIAGIMDSVISVAAVWVLFSKVQAIGGWNFPQVILIYGFSILSRSLFHLFCVNIVSISTMVREGGMDRILVRPLNPLYQVLADYLDNDDYGEFLLGCLLVWFSLGGLGIRTLPNVIWAVIAVISGGTIYLSVHIIVNTVSFFTIENKAITGLAWQLDEFTRYPLNIYGRGIRAFLTWVVPFGFVSFFSAQPLFRVSRNWVFAGWLTPIVALVFFGVAYGFWKWGLSNYQGVGN